MVGAIKKETKEKPLKISLRQKHDRNSTRARKNDAFVAKRTDIPTVQRKCHLTSQCCTHQSEEQSTLRKPLEGSCIRIVDFQNSWCISC
jgi:hypothetical protein